MGVACSGFWVPASTQVAFEAFPRLPSRVKRITDCCEQGLITDCCLRITFICKSLEHLRSAFPKRERFIKWILCHSCTLASGRFRAWRNNSYRHDRGRKNKTGPGVLFVVILFLYRPERRRKVFTECCFYLYCPHPFLDLRLFDGYKEVVVVVVVERLLFVFPVVCFCLIFKRDATETDQGSKLVLVWQSILVKGIYVRA